MRSFEFLTPRVEPCLCAFLSLIRRSRHALRSRRCIAIRNERIQGQQGCPATELSLLFPSPAAAAAIARLKVVVFQSQALSLSLSRARELSLFVPARGSYLLRRVLAAESWNGKIRTEARALLEIQTSRFSLFRASRSMQKKKKRKLTTLDLDLLVTKKKQQQWRKKRMRRLKRKRRRQRSK